jgi:hypothetical protein
MRIMKKMVIFKLTEDDKINYATLNGKKDKNFYLNYMFEISIILNN